MTFSTHRTRRHSVKNTGEQGAKNDLERVDGIEPTIPLWKRGVLPLNYTRDAEADTFALACGRSSLRSAPGEFEVFTYCERKWDCGTALRSFAREHGINLVGTVGFEFDSAFEETRYQR